MREDAGGAAADCASSDVRVLARARFELGRAAWPWLPLEGEAFERYFELHVIDRDAPSEAYAEDMYLACACACGVEPALAAIERTMVAEVARAITSIDSSRAFVEETLQALREKLFVGKGPGTGKIIEYSGRGSLKGWLCAVAVRCAIGSRRRKAEQRHETFTTEGDRRLARGGPEFEYLRTRYKEAFEDAIREAIQGLPTRARLLLRLNLVDGMSVDKLGTMYGVGRSTAARWLAGARGALLERARLGLRMKLRLTSTELDALAVDLLSQLDVSIVGLLLQSSQTTASGPG